MLVGYNSSPTAKIEECNVTAPTYFFALHSTCTVEEFDDDEEEEQDWPIFG
jgi:hypothetical protein